MIFNCPLCEGESSLLMNYRDRNYFRCTSCLSAFADSETFLDSPEEEARYLEHKNDVFDPNYRKFVAPIVDTVTAKFSAEHVGLDFGSGTGPVISKVLEEKGYKIFQFDPFFHNQPEMLTKKYDYIVSCEVIEHFHRPRAEFKQLHSMLKPNGELICMTDVFYDTIDFSKWYYKSDPTHVLFYHPKAFEYIKEEFGFSDVIVNKRLIRFLI